MLCADASGRVRSDAECTPATGPQGRIRQRERRQRRAVIERSDLFRQADASLNARKIALMRV